MTMAIMPNTRSADSPSSGSTPERRDRASPIPLALLSFSASRSRRSALLQWSTTEEKSTSRFVIEKGTDAVAFRDIDSLAATGDSNTVSNYPYTDKHLWNGVNYYRLKMVGNDGHFKYSPVRSVNDTLSAPSVQVSIPIPSSTGTLYVSHFGQLPADPGNGRLGQDYVQSIDTHGFSSIRCSSVISPKAFTSSTS